MATEDLNRRVDLDKYTRVRQPTEKAETAPLDEVRVSSGGRLATYIGDIAKLLKGEGEEASKTVTIKCTGNALGKAVTLAEIIKRRIGGLHQVTKVGSTEVTDVYEPKSGEGESIEQKRNLSFMEIKLSLDPLDKMDTGYQAPLPASEVEEKGLEELLNPPKRDLEEAGEGEEGEDGEKKKGKGKRSKGKGKGKASKGKGKGKKGKGKKGKGKGKSEEGATEEKAE